MISRKTTHPSPSVETWPVIWRIVKFEAGGEVSTIDEVTNEEFARRRTEELRDFGWPVRLERVALEPVPPTALNPRSIQDRLRALRKRSRRS
jgi:hypothetical protein